MSDGAKRAGTTPISSRSAGPAGTAEFEGRHGRILGFRADEIGNAAWLPDDPRIIGRAILGDGRPFNGAFVPMVIHDSEAAERTFDAAEFAADLIAAEGGRGLCVSPFTTREWQDGTPPSAREWNHAVAMIERLEEVCVRYGLVLIVGDSGGDHPMREGGGLRDDLPIHYVLDTGNFLPDGYVPALLISPDVDGDAQPEHG